MATPTIYTISARRLVTERNRRATSLPKEVSTLDALNLVSSYKKKAVARLKTFYAESQRMDKKLSELLEKVKALGIIIDKITINNVDAENVVNYRKRSKTLTFNVEARRDGYALHGNLTITPASMKLELNCSDLRRITTKNGWYLPLLKVSYYRTLNVKDNYLASLVGGGKPSFTDIEVDF